MYRILIAEDDRVHGVMLKRYLEMLGHEATIAANGLEALQLYDGHDLILMDITMPEMDGLDATRSFRQREKEDGTDQPVPILAITAQTARDCKMCMEAGMSGLMTKPVFMAALVAAMNEYIPGSDQDVSTPTGA